MPVSYYKKKKATPKKKYKPFGKNPRKRPYRAKSARFNATPKGLADIRDAKEELGVTEKTLTTASVRAQLQSKKIRIDKHLAKFLYQLENGIGLSPDLKRIGVPHQMGGHIRRIARSFTVQSNGTGFLFVGAMPHQAYSTTTTDTSRAILVYTNASKTGLDATTLWSASVLGPGVTNIETLYEDSAPTPEQAFSTVQNSVVPQRCVSYQLRITPIGPAAGRQGILTIGEVPMHTQVCNMRKQNLGYSYQQDNHEMAVAQATDGLQVAWHPKFEEELNYHPRWVNQTYADPTVGNSSSAYQVNGPAPWDTVNRDIYCPQLYIFGEGLGENQPFLLQMEYVFEVAKQQVGTPSTAIQAEDGRQEAMQDNHHPHTLAAVTALDANSGGYHADPTPKGAHNRGTKHMEASTGFGTGSLWNGN